MKTIKRIFLACVLLIALSQAEAQVTFKPGLRAGVNFSHFTDGDYTNGTSYFNGSFVTDERVDFSSKTDFYVGFYGALRLTKYYTLQPEFTYSRQGSKFESTSYDPGNNVNYRSEGQIDVSYISIAIVNKFTFNDKFNMHIGPTIDVIVEDNGFNPNSSYYNNYDGYNYYSYDTIESDIDLAFVLGLGYNFTKNLGLEVRVKKGVIPVLDLYDSNNTNVVFSGGLTYTFDLK